MFEKSADHYKSLLRSDYYIYYDQNSETWSLKKTIKLDGILSVISEPISRHLFEQLLKEEFIVFDEECGHWLRSFNV